jgi:hypothetical protein
MGFMDVTKDGRRWRIGTPAMSPVGPDEDALPPGLTRD